MKLSYQEQREQLLQAAQRLGEAQVMSHSGHGNMSMRLPESGHMLLTSVSHLAHLTPEQLVVVSFDENVIEGTLDPTSREIVGMHACVYQERKTETHAALWLNLVSFQSLCCPHATKPAQNS